MSNAMRVLPAALVLALGAAAVGQEPAVPTSAYNRLGARAGSKLHLQVDDGYTLRRDGQHFQAGRPVDKRSVDPTHPHCLLMGYGLRDNQVVQFNGGEYAFTVEEYKSYRAGDLYVTDLFLKDGYVLSLYGRGDYMSIEDLRRVMGDGCKVWSK